MNRLLIFDLDGTVIDSGRDLTNAANFVRGHYGLAPLSTAEILSFVGNGQRVLVERFLKEIEGGYDFEEAVGKMREYYNAHALENTTTYPGVMETLALLKELGYVMAVASNKPSAAARAVCEGLGLTPYMQIILGGGDTAELKPSAQPLLKAMQAANAAPENTWMIGDNYTDLEAARNAGVRSCFCAFGFGSPKGEAFTAKIESFPELLAAVESQKNPRSGCSGDSFDG